MSNRRAGKPEHAGALPKKEISEDVTPTEGTARHHIARAESQTMVAEANVGAFAEATSAAFDEAARETPATLLDPPSPTFYGEGIGHLLAPAQAALDAAEAPVRQMTIDKNGDLRELVYPLEMHRLNIEDLPGGPFATCADGCGRLPMSSLAGPVGAVLKFDELSGKHKSPAKHFVSATEGGQS